MIVSGIPFIQGRNAYSDPDGKKYAIAIHNTSNDGTAEEEAAFATRRTDGISSHFYADSNSVIQSLNTVSRAGHAGNSNGNNNAIAVEITGFNAWSRATWLSNVAWDLLGNVLAQVCRAYSIPAVRCTVSQMKQLPTVRGFYSHDDMRLAWGGTTHTDPGPNFPWDRLFQAVNQALNPPTSITGEDMDYNQSQKLTAIFDAMDKVRLDTDGTPDGQGAGQDFVVPIVKLIKDNQKAVTDAIAALSTGGVTQDMLNTAMAQALQDPAVLAALTPVIENAAFTAAQRAEDE